MYIFKAIYTDAYGCDVAFFRNNRSAFEWLKTKEYETKLRTYSSPKGYIPAMETQIEELEVSGEILKSLGLL